MKEVRIADLKARLSEHLRYVRRGHELTVLDRDTPIARLVPVEAPTGLAIRRPVGARALLELRVRNEQGDVPWDGLTMGELEVRGAYVASAYYRPEEDGGWFTADGWFRRGGGGGGAPSQVDRA